jgi:hypothetical protein
VFDLKIERLRLTIRNAAGHEHRIQPIALRALALLADQLDGPNMSVVSGRQFDALTARPIDLNLSEVSDEQAAAGIASVWANALTARTGGQD